VKLTFFPREGAQKINQRLGEGEREIMKGKRSEVCHGKLLFMSFGQGGNDLVCDAYFDRLLTLN
jgi:hypothetical protein